MSENTESECLMRELTTMSYDNVGGIKKYIMKMINLQTKLKGLKIDPSAFFLMPYALNSLSTEFFQIKIAYNTLMKLEVLMT